MLTIILVINSCCNMYVCRNKKNHVRSTPQHPSLRLECLTALQHQLIPIITKLCAKNFHYNIGTGLVGCLIFCFYQTSYYQRYPKTKQVRCRYEVDCDNHKLEIKGRGAGQTSTFIYYLIIWPTNGAFTFTLKVQKFPH